MKRLNMLKAIFSGMILAYILAFFLSSKAHGELPFPTSTMVNSNPTIISIELLTFNENKKVVQSSYKQIKRCIAEIK